MNTLLFVKKWFEQSQKVAILFTLVGAVAAIVLTGQDRSILGLIGMISLCGIVTRNGILIIDHYFYLVKHEGESLTKDMIVRAGRNRAAPVLMTVMTTIFSLIPITLAPDMPGREILYPIATVIVGGFFYLPYVIVIFCYLMNGTYFDRTRPTRITDK